MYWTLMKRWTESAAQREWVILGYVFIIQAPIRSPQLDEIEHIQAAPGCGKNELKLLEGVASKKKKTD